MRLMFLGDVVGRAGRDGVAKHLPGLRDEFKLDLVVINGENAAGGFGITEKIYDQLRSCGADVVTLGNHAWDQREALVFIERRSALVRPVNFPGGTPGRGSGLYEAANGKQVLVINAMGRIMMDPLDDPFAAVERELGACLPGAGCDAAIIDMHAEATSEKLAMGHFCDGRASLVVGTHTHIPTADHQILPGGTGFMTDAGMCGDYDSIIGMDKEEPLRRFCSKIPGGRMHPAMGEATVSGVAIETNDKTGLCEKISPVRMGGRLQPVLPDFW